MSNVPKLRFKEFSREWEEKRLEDLARLVTKQTGFDYSSKIKPSLETIKNENNVPFIQNKDFSSTHINLNTDFFIPKSVQQQFPRITLDEKSMLITISGKIGNVGVYDKEEIAFIGGAVGIVKFKDEYKTSINFVKDYLTTTIGQKLITREVKASSHQNITVEGIRDFKIKLPSKQEQEKIASFLTSIDTKIEQLSKKEELLKQYKKGVMQKIFSQEIRFKANDGSEFEDWEDKKLEKVLKEPKKTAVENPNEIELLTVQLHCKGVKRSGNFPTVTKNGRPYYVRNKDELLIGRQNFHNGGMGIVNDETNGFICSNAITSLVAIKDNINFIYMLLSRTDYYKRIDNLIGGTGQKEISKTELNKLKLKMPCLEEQTKIANFLSSIDSKIEQVSKQLDSTKEFKKALLQQMFV